MVRGSANFDPGVVLSYSVDAGTVWVEPAAEGPVGVSGKANFDLWVVLATVNETHGLYGLDLLLRVL